MDYSLRTRLTLQWPFSALILLVSSCATFSRCSMYSCLMSSLDASIFRGFLDAWTFRDGRTNRLWSIMAEASLGGSREGYPACLWMWWGRGISHPVWSKNLLTLVPENQKWHRNPHWIQSLLAFEEILPRACRTWRRFHHQVSWPPSRPFQWLWEWFPADLPLSRRTKHCDCEAENGWSKHMILQIY